MVESSRRLALPFVVRQVASVESVEEKGPSKVVQLLLGAGRWRNGRDSRAGGMWAGEQGQLEVQQREPEIKGPERLASKPSRSSQRRRSRKEGESPGFRRRPRSAVLRSRSERSRHPTRGGANRGAAEEAVCRASRSKARDDDRLAPGGAVQSSPRLKAAQKSIGEGRSREGQGERHEVDDCRKGADRRGEGRTKGAQGSARRELASKKKCRSWW